MLSFFPKQPTAFKPLIAPIPQRQPCGGGCSEQFQSPFFGRLPAEIRNEIYRYAFTGEFREQLSVKGHPLSLLLTCHRASHEATTLAFSCHAFQISKHLELNTFVTLRTAISHMSPQLKDAVTALCYDLGCGYFRSENALAAGEVLTNAILLFPNFARFEVRILRGQKRGLGIHQGTMPLWCYTYKDARNTAAQIYAPHWFANSILRHSGEGHSYAWQAGQQWTLDWPQAASDEYLDVLDSCDWNGNPCLKPFMGSDAVGKVRGVHMCPCPCDQVSWTSADMVQATGRRIKIDTIYYGPEERPLPPLDGEMALKARLGHKAVILREGASRLRVEECQVSCVGTGAEVTSVAYDGGDDYWEALRRKNGDWRAVARTLWKDPMDSLCGTSKDKFLGSWSLGEGDWARIKEVTKTKRS
ncbi:hypothetical protein EK21DRAFT_86903 [Setomelanomma holmii]|uniref:Uncharacterized protein n=1 Tax=Setomelanomma holmii TaxID=210430 RepID=A0A9P4HGL3_9PLEO|nr:hypothetical protein EK21DRAFT_86903 [Setomelanomma holmii]